MAVTSQIMAHTPLTGSGLSIPAANKQREFAKWVEAKEIRTTPFTDWMKRRGTPYGQVDIETGQSYHPFITTAIKTLTLNNSTSIDVDSTAYLREGDVLSITQYYANSTTELDPETTEYATILSITDSDTVVVNRHQGEVSSGSWAAHPVDSEVRVISRAQNYNEPFPDAITYRGDLIVQHPQRIDIGELTYDLAAVKVKDFESNNHMERDIMRLKDEALKYRENAFITGRKVTGDYLASPQKPYQMGGAIWWSEQGPDNESAVDGQLNLFTFDDIYRAKAENHVDGPGDTAFCSYKTGAIVDTLLNEMRLKGGGFGANDTTMTFKTSKLSYRYGDLVVKPIHGFPDGKILITSKADWEWGHFIGMDWQYVMRGPEELGAFQKSWTAGGDFSMTCLNVTRQILVTGIDMRLDEYSGRQFFT
jgi:hypothetical protein